MTWPDKSMSKIYLEEALKFNPDSFLVKFFLADTLYALGEKNRAVGYYDEVRDAAPENNINYFQDLKVKRNCAERMKELGIK